MVAFPSSNRPAFAALDLGTNNCRLLIGAPRAAGFRVLESFSRIVRLGEGLRDTGRLAPAAMDRAIVALAVCAERLAGRDLAATRAIATEACRRAANGAEFLARARRETGIALTAVTAREEAELALEGCQPLLAGGDRADRRALVFDIGGGSTELIWVRLDTGHGTLIGYDSLPIGVVTLAEQFGAAAFEPAGFAAMVADVAGRLTAFESIHCIRREVAQGGVRLLGTSGTVTTVAGVMLDLPRYSRPMIDGITMRAEAAMDALARIRALGREGLASHPCIGPERVEFTLPGCAVFAAIHALWPTPDIVVADRGLREGMMLRMIREHRAPPRRAGAIGSGDRVAVGHV